MTNEHFKNILQMRLAATETTLAKKAHEYASDEDRLHNFKKAAMVLNCTPKQALLGMLAKHLVSVIDLVNDPADATWALWDEKIGDSINYLILLEALVKEE